jgi:hypothetical protein
VLVNCVVLTYPTVPNPLTVLIKLLVKVEIVSEERALILLKRLREETYPVVPKPATVLCKFLFGKNPAVVLIRFPVDIYREGSINQAVVLTRDAVLT